MVKTASRDSLLSYTQKKRLKSILHAVTVILVMVLFVSPLYISLIYSLKRPEEIGTAPPMSLPRSLYLGNIKMSNCVLKGSVEFTGNTFAETPLTTGAQLPEGGVNAADNALIQKTKIECFK